MLYGFHNWLKIQTFFLAEIIELRKGVIILLHIKEGGLERHFQRNTQNAELKVDLF